MNQSSVKWVYTLNLLCYVRIILVHVMTVIMNNHRLHKLSQHTDCFNGHFPGKPVAAMILTL